MVEQKKRRALALALEPQPIEPLRTYCGKFDPQAATRPFTMPVVYPFESEAPDDAVEDHVLTVLEEVKPFTVLLRGITAYPGGFILLNVKAGNDRVLLVHDLLHTGPLAGVYNPLYTYFPHVPLFRCGTPEHARVAVQEGLSLTQGFEALVKTIRFDELYPDGKIEPISSLDLAV